MAKKNKKKKTLTPEMKRRRNAARAKLASLFAAAVLLAGVGVVIKTSTKTHIPLDINASGYEWLDTVDHAAVTEAPAGENVSDDPEEPAAEVFNPVLEEEYPIDMEIRSQFAIVYDATSDKVLYAKNAEDRCYPASTTKILTAAVTLKYAPEDMVFTCGDELDLVNPGSSLAMVNKGSQLDLSMMIDAMMLPSGNDASYSAAANIGRLLSDDENISPKQAVQLFVDEMNRTALSIGCEGTHFSDPDGFHENDHYTTVKDMLRIALYAQDYDMLLESARKPTRYARFLTGEEVSWENSNKLLHDYSDCYYMYATGMKTGMTDEAGHCVVATAERFEHQIFCLVFGAPAADVRWNDTIALLDAAFVAVRTGKS